MQEGLLLRRPRREKTPDIHLAWDQSPICGPSFFGISSFDHRFLFDIQHCNFAPTAEIPASKRLPWFPLFSWAIDNGVVSFLRLLEQPPTGDGVYVYCHQDIYSDSYRLIRACRSGSTETVTYFVDTLCKSPPKSSEALWDFETQLSELI